MNRHQINHKSFFNFKGIFYKGWLKDYVLIFLGTFIVAIGFDLFLIPYNITPGGVSSLGIMVNHLTQGMFTDISFLDSYNGAIPVGFFIFCVDVPLFFIGIRVLGKKFGPKTVFGFITLAFFLDTIQYNLANIAPGGDVLGLKDDLLLASLYGGVIIGVGLGIIFKTHATSGGTDVIAMIISKLSKNISIGRGVMLVDSIIIGVSFVVFQEWKLPLYSLLTLWVTAKVIDIYIDGLSVNKAVLVISKKEDEIREKILNGLDRGGTMFDVKGMYTHDDQKLIFTVVSRREVSILKDFIKHIDPRAFTVVLDAHEAIGEGFNSFEDED